MQDAMRAFFCGTALLHATLVAAQEPAKVALPTADEAVQLLAAEPFSLATWPAWRERLLAWIDQDATVVDSLYEASWTFALSQADAEGRLNGELANDFFAWYLLGSAQLASGDMADLAANTKLASAAVRRSLELNDGVHYGLFPRIQQQMAAAAS